MSKPLEGDVIQDYRWFHVVTTELGRVIVYFPRGELFCAPKSVEDAKRWIDQYIEQYGEPN